MPPGTAKVMKCLPAHLVAEQLPQLVFTDILNQYLHIEA